MVRALESGGCASFEWRRCIRNHRTITCRTGPQRWIGCWFCDGVLTSSFRDHVEPWHLYFGLPASSSHTLIGSIMGVGLANSILAKGHVFGEGVNWAKASEVGLSLMISPLVGFCAAAGLLLLTKALVKRPELFKPPEGKEPPPSWIRGLLVLTCTGVSFAHGSNDGQKGMGLIMLIMVGILPGAFALNSGASHQEVVEIVSSLMLPTRR